MKSTFSHTIAGLLALLLSILALPAKAQTIYYYYIYDSSNPQSYTQENYDGVATSFTDSFTTLEEAKFEWEMDFHLLQSSDTKNYRNYYTDQFTQGTVTTFKISSFPTSTSTSTSTNPEPETLAMMAIGLAVVGWMAKRRNSKAALTGRAST